MLPQNLTTNDTAMSTGHHSRNMSDTAALIAGPYMVILTLLGCVENSFVLVVFARHRTLLGRSNNVLVMFIAIVDFLMSTVSFPFIAASTVANRWLFSTWGCYWYAASMTCLGLTSISLLTCLAVERCIVISQKQEPPVLSVGRAKRFAAACFIWGAIIGVCPLIGWGSYDLEPVFPSCTPVWWRRDPNNLSFIMTIFTAAFFLPICIITYAYVMIFKKVCERQKSSPGHSSHEVRVALISLAMIVFFLLSWGPYAIVALLQTFNESFYVPDFLNIMPVMMAKSSVVWNPIIYLGRNIKFMQAFSEELSSTQKSLRKLLSVTPSSSARTSSGRRSSDKDSSPNDSIGREQQKIQYEVNKAGSDIVHPITNTTKLIEVCEYETSL